MNYMFKSLSDRNFLDFFKNLDKIILILLCVILGVLPFIVRLHFDTNGIQSSNIYELLPKSKFYYDFFHYYKAIALILISFIILCLSLRQKHNYYHKSFFLLFLFTFLVLFSSLITPYLSYAFMGGLESYQGVFVWISYTIIFFAASQIQKLNYLKILVVVALISSFLLGLIGIVQYLGFDIRFALQEIIMHSGNTLTPIEQKRSIISLFYNINYYGVFTLIFSILSVLLFLHSTTKLSKVVSILVYVVIYFNLVGSNSRAGNISYLLSFLILTFILLRSNRKKFLKKIVFVSGLSVLVYFSYVTTTNSEGKMVNIDLGVAKYSSLKDIKVKDSIMCIQPHTLKPLYIKATKLGQLNFFTDKNMSNKLTFLQSDTIKFADLDYNHYSFNIGKSNDFNVLQLNYDKSLSIPIVVKNQKFHLLIKDQLKPFYSADKWEFFNYYNKFASGRGAIWSLSAPLLKESLFYGYGADCFSLAYPNKDYVAAMKTFGTKSTYHLKAAHSLYFQIGIEFGVLALVSFLLFCFWYLWNTIKILVSLSFIDTLDFICLGSFSVVFAFLFSGITNSAMITTFPVFWIFLGVGFAVNRLLKLRETQL